MPDRALPESVLPRVGQLIRLLGSDQPGEVVAAVGALRRTLGGVGADLHDLAATVERPAAAAPEPKPRKARKARARPAEAPRRPSPPPPREPHRPDLVSLTGEQRAAIVKGLQEAVDDVDGLLNDWQHEFSVNLLDTIGRRRLCPTERQMQFIRDIVATVRGEAS